MMMKVVRAAQWSLVVFGFGIAAFAGVQLLRASGAMPEACLKRYDLTTPIGDVLPRPLYCSVLNP